MRPESAQIKLPKNNQQDSFNQKKTTFPPRPQSAQIGKWNRQYLHTFLSFRKPQNNHYQQQIEEEEDEYKLPNMDLNQLILNPPSSQQNDQRKMPKNIKKDKERLYEELIDVKQQMNKVREENTRLKTKMLTLQKENAKLEKLLENVEGYLNHGTSHQPIGDHILMNSLKKQMKDLKNQLEDKETELLQMKRNIKITKTQELEAELKGYIEESIRLRSLLDQALRNQAAQKITQEMDSFEEKFYVQMKVINSLQQEIDNLNGVIKLKEEEIFNKNIAFDKEAEQKESVEEKCEYLEADLRESRQKVELLEKEIVNVKNLNNNLIIKATKAHNDDMKLTDYEAKFDEQRKEIIGLQKQIELLEKSMSDMKYNYQDNFNQLERERKYFETEMERYKILYEQSSEERKHFAEQEPIMFHTGATLTQQFTKNLQDEQEKVQQQVEDSKTKSNKPTVKKRKRTVKLEDVKDIGLQLNLRFRIRKLKLDEIIENDLFDPLILSRGTVSIKDIAIRLSNTPFDLRNVEDIYLIARYLIEDNRQDYVDYDEELQASTQIVKSIFSKLIGKCKIFTKEEENRLKEELQMQIVKYKRSLQSYLPTFNQQYLTRDQLVKAFKFMGMEISSDALDFFFLRLFELGGEKDVRRFDYKKIVEEWGQEEPTRSKEERKEKGGNKQLDDGNQQFNMFSRFTYDKS